MSQRSSTNKAKDARVFKDTASKIKKANILSKPMRGGIRL